MASWRSFWRTVMRRQRFEAELDEELRFHLECRAADLQRAGLPPEQARRQARIELGAVEAHKEEVRRARGVRVLDELAGDLRFAVRGWRRHRGLALAVTFILSVGIGIPSTTFTFINAALFRPPVRFDPPSFVKLFVAHATAPATHGSFDPPELEDLRALEGASRTLAAVAGLRSIGGRLGNERQDVRGVLVTCDFFAVHPGMRPLLGRLLDRRDCAEGAPVMVMGEGLWRGLGADPGLVGRVLSYQRHPFTLVGVVQGELEAIPKRTALFVPYTQGGHWPPAVSWERRFDTAGRLRPGFTRADAAAELTLLLRQQDARHPGRTSQVVVTDGSEIAGPSHHQDLLSLALLLGVLAMIVLLVCANVVTLLLARAHARRHEIAVRLSLGAGRGRLMRMLLVEILPLAAVAAGVGVVLARELPPVLLAYVKTRPRGLPLEPDWRVWLFVAAVTVVAAVASGLTPALEALKVGLIDALKGRAGPTQGRRRLPHLLVSAQIAVTVVLLAGASLFVRAYLRISSSELGFDVAHTLFAPLRALQDEPASWTAVHRAVIAELRATPGIEALALAEEAPPGGQYQRIQLAEEGRSRLALVNGVSPELFATLGLPILRGRTFRAGESATAAVVPVIVSRGLARVLWGQRDPLGGQLRGGEGQSFEVVGVVGDILLPGRSDIPIFYCPLPLGPAVVLARFSGPAASASAALEAGVHRAAPGVFAAARTFESRFADDAHSLGRFAVVVGAVGGCGLLLALVGIYGTVAFTVRRRSREMGIRAALGAGSADLVAALVTPTVRAVGVGLLAGVILAVLLAPGLRPLTGELPFRDPLVHGAGALLLACAALLAMLGPVLRSLALDRGGGLAAVLRDE
jgi:predicted permease